MSIEYQLQIQKKICRKCNNSYSIYCFQEFKSKTNGKLYRKNSCKLCIAKQSKLWTRKLSNEDRVKRCYKNKFNLSIQDVKNILLLQNNKCANNSCGQHLILFQGILGKGKYACVDHDHKTGRVRGLLCHKCNLALGYSQDNIFKLIGLVEYLIKNNG